LIERWLKAGILESGPMGTGGDRDAAGIRDQPDPGQRLPPLMLSTYGYIHWRRHHAAAQIVVCRYADDLAIGCQQEADGKLLSSSI